jgi:hypothetical protein
VPNRNSISKLKNLETQFARQLLKAFLFFFLQLPTNITAEIEIEAFCSASISQGRELENEIFHFKTLNLHKHVKWAADGRESKLMG